MTYTLEELKKLNEEFIIDLRGKFLMFYPYENYDMNCIPPSRSFLIWLEAREKKQEGLSIGNTVQTLRECHIEPIQDVENWDTEAVNPPRPSRKVKVKKS